MCDCGCEALNGIPEEDERCPCTLNNKGDDCPCGCHRWEPVTAANKIIAERTMVSMDEAAQGLQQLARRMNQIERGES